MGYPEWVQKHKQKGTAVVKKNDKCYYLYKVHSRYDPNKHRAQKITEKYLGKITPEGFQPSKTEAIQKNITDNKITVKEHGATQFLHQTNSDLIELLQKYFPSDYKEIFVFAAFRLIRNSPIKNLSFLNSTSFIYNTLQANMNDKRTGQMLRELGTQRARTTEFLSNFVFGSGYLAVDLTHIVSLAENVVSSTTGYNSKGDYSPQVNMLYLFSLTRKVPVYFRTLPGSIASVSSLALSIKESGAKDVVLIGDKGFYSESNVEDLEKQLVHYILPLKRDSLLIDYDVIRSGNLRRFCGHFVFEKRSIHYYFYDVGTRRVFVFLDDRLRAEEMKDAIKRLGADEESRSRFYELSHRMGTVSVITDLKVRDGKEVSGEEVYSFLKQRLGIEQLYDTFKNTLEADRSYMRDDYQLEGWMFIGFVTMLLYYRLYNLLAEKKALKEYSVKDAILHLERIQKLRIGDRWVVSEIPKKTIDLLQKLEVHIT
jgi:hypothetical protein